MSFVEAIEQAKGANQPGDTAPQLCDILQDGSVVSAADFAEVGSKHPDWVERGETVDSITCQHCGACAIAGMKFRHEPSAVPGVPRPRKEAA